MQDTDQYVGKSLPRISKFVENSERLWQNVYQISIKLLQEMDFKLVLKFYLNLML